MSERTKESFSRWSPLAVSLIINAVVVVYGYGKMDQRVLGLEQYAANNTVENSMKIFVTKSEFSLRNDTRDRELTDMKASVSRIEQKLDRLLESRQAK